MSLEKTCLVCKRSFRGLTNHERVCSAKCRKIRKKMVRDGYKRKKKRELEWRKREKRYRKSYDVGIKMEALSIQNDGKCCCVACGESDLATLSLDHIDDGGCLDRRLNNSTGGQPIYRSIVYGGKSERFQVLCLNCQFRKRAYGSDFAVWNEIRKECEEIARKWIEKKRQQESRPRLSEEEVEEIKNILRNMKDPYVSGTNPDLAKKFGTTSHTISCIKSVVMGTDYGYKHFYKS